MITYGKDYEPPPGWEQVALDGPVTVRLADVRPEQVDWLWRGRLPLGKVAVLDGDPSIGKSTLAIDWAARVSTGSPWPDRSPCPRGAVLILSAEDGLADTIRPRLDAAEGDPARVHAFTEIRHTDGGGSVRSRPPTLADVDSIEQLVKAHGVTLVIVDVLMAYLPTHSDAYRDQDMRGVLSALAALADRCRCSILLLRHLSKSHGGNPLYAGGGSIGIAGAARAGLLAAVDPDDDTRRVLAVSKQNLAAIPSALGYRLVDSPEHGCARVEWLGEHGSSASDLLLVRNYGTDPERADVDEAVEWVLMFLTEVAADHFAPAAEVLAAGQAAGFAKHTLQRAHKRAGIRTHKADFGGGWVWALPPEGDGQGDEHATSRERHLRHLERHLGGAESTHDWVAAADRLLGEQRHHDRPVGRDLVSKSTRTRCDRCGRPATRRQGNHPLVVPSSRPDAVDDALDLASRNAGSWLHDYRPGRTTAAPAGSSKGGHGGRAP